MKATAQQNVNDQIFSICVPSRNRQVYFQETILALLKSPRQDIEFVFTDNSDQPEIMNGFMSSLPHDPRVRYLPSGPQVYSMLDNWERTVSAARGDWVTVIGDDDYLDPAVFGLMKRVMVEKPDLEVFEWGRLAFDWPVEGTIPNRNVSVSLVTHLEDVPKARILARAFLWEGAVMAPSVGSSIYHSAVSRPLLERIKARFGNRYFEHPIVDYDNAFKVALTGTGFVTCFRPFSVLGSCPQSNSAALLDLKKLEARIAEFENEAGTRLDENPYFEEFPFSARLGLAASVMQVQHGLKRTYGLNFSNWERNFAETCARNCNQHKDRAVFDVHVEGYRRAFERWRGGKFLPDFKPVYQPQIATEGHVFSGRINQTVYLSMALLNPPTPAALYQIVDRILVPPEEMDARPNRIA